jgi:hypothetical protein
MTLISTGRRIKLVLTTFRLTAEKGRACIGFEK